MELKEYQASALQDFARWRKALEKACRESEEQIADLQGRNIPEEAREAIHNYPKVAWNNLKQKGGVAKNAGKYVSRTDTAGRPIPHVCFKVPTGGGKTLLAAASLGRLHRPTGLTLWIVPSRAIYEQTRAALRNREHPCRHQLEMASGGRVKLLEKDDRFTRADAANYLCVMLLMLPAANRQKGKEFLRMFRDSERYPTLFPDGDDVFGEERLLQDYPDLERASENGPIKHSLFNVFKMLRPVVVLDETHKAYGIKRKGANEEFVRSINRLDPRMVIELSATPNRGISNLLVDITGIALKNEEMIKIPVEVTSFTNADWHHTLAQAHEELERLHNESQSLQRKEGRYIRPIAVVRVERTGKDQRDGRRIHAEDVREYLVQNLGAATEAVKVKSSSLDELADIDLLSEFSPVRWVITKSALMEGWDCPFAYILVMLDNTSAQRAITQLVDRVMRQPHAFRTGRKLLDQCYVYCWNTQVSQAVEQVKNGLELEGLTGLNGEVFEAGAKIRRVTIKRRDAFKKESIFLPLVLHKKGKKDWVELDYQRHILPEVDWDAIDVSISAGRGESAVRQSASVDVGEDLPIIYDERELFIDKTVRLLWFVRCLSDIVPNPWQSTRIVSLMVEKLQNSREGDDNIYDQRSHLSFLLRERVSKNVETQAEQVFRRKLQKGDIRFDLEAGQPNFRMVESYEVPATNNNGLLSRKNGQPVQISLFEPIYAQHFDTDLERKFARYLDEQKALCWWYRVAVRQRGEYYLRGWKQERIWPDFVAMGGEVDGKPHVLVFEIKGEHLRGNSDTCYKQQVLETLQDTFNEKAVAGGAMTVRKGLAKGTFQLVFNEQEFSKVLADLP